MLFRSNDFRFGYMNDFTYISVKTFADKNLSKIVLGSDFKGSIFVKLQVANYIFCPDELHNVCVYDFFSKYIIVKGKKKVRGCNHFKFSKNHPSSRGLYVVERETPAVPCISYLDFPDAKTFGGTCIDVPDLNHLTTDDPELDYMEKYSTVACVLFCPFHNIDDVKGSDGKHLTYFRHFLRDGKLKTEHRAYLSNAQDCR